MTEVRENVQQEVRLALLHSCIFDVFSDSYGSQEKALQVLRDVLISQADHIRDPRIRARVLQWKAALEEIECALGSGK